ncbi:hypothetical protein JCM8202_002810 [Rhodotorula sphaerocarpa]
MSSWLPASYPRVPTSTSSSSAMSSAASSISGWSAGAGQGLEGELGEGSGRRQDGLGISSSEWEAEPKPFAGPMSGKKAAAAERGAGARTKRPRTAGPATVIQTLPATRSESFSMSRGKVPLSLDPTGSFDGSDSSARGRRGTAKIVAAAEDLASAVRTAMSNLLPARGNSEKSRYPQSPSLLRPHPSIRHSHTSPRRAWRQAVYASLVLVTLVVFAREHGRVRSSTRAVRAYVADELFAPRSDVVSAASSADRDQPEATQRHLQNHNAAPARLAPTAPSPPDAAPAAATDTTAVTAGDDEPTLPFLADGQGGGDEGEATSEDEQAGLAAIVQQASKAALAKDDDASEPELHGDEEGDPAISTKETMGADGASRNEAVMGGTDEAAAKAQQAIDRAKASAERKKKQKAKKKQRDPTKYKRLLPLGAPPRRYLYGANFVIADDDEEARLTVKNPERTNAMIKTVPTKKQLDKIFAAGRQKYAEEEPSWRAYEWKAPPAHASLLRFIDKLSAEEVALRSWIQALHKQPPARGVGLASRTGPKPVDSLAPLPAFDRGSRTKWTDLSTQAEQGHAGKCQGSTWLQDYATMHAKMLAGKQEPKFISYHCEQGMNCGGLGDRLLGMTSAFFFGLVTKRAFLAEWQSPVPLDVIFDSPHIDWSYSSYAPEQHPVFGQKRLAAAAASAADLDIIHFDRLAVDATFGIQSWNPKPDRPLTPGFEQRDIAYQSPWIKFFSNRGMVYRSFKYKHLQKTIARLGLQDSNAFSCISEYLFKPKPAALDLITQYTSVMALPTVFSVGIHVRTGDQSMKDAEYDKVNTVKRHIAFFRCARELGETYARPDQRVVFYLVTDSRHLKEDAQRVLGSKLITTDFAPQHVHQKSGHVDGVMSAVVEDYVLAKADMLVATQDSGFGKLASFMMAKPNSTVTIFPKFNPDVLGLLSKSSHVNVDCTSPTVFTSFEELSSEWSLG